MTSSRPARDMSLATDPDDLARLLSGVAAGRREDFERLYGLASAKLLGIALRILRDRHAAEDVVQDVFVRIWQSAGSYSAEAGRPMTWLISITRNRAIDVVRRKTEVAAPDTADGVDWMSEVADPRDAESEFLEADRLRLCLDRLDESHRRCFVDAYREGYTREELAERYGKPVNTIKTWLHRSAQSLRSCLDAQ